MKHQGDDQMDALLALALKDAETEDPFADLDISSVEFSKAYQCQRKRNISRYIHASGLSSVRKIRARVALAVACILVVCLIAVMSISAVRDAIFGAIIEWYDDYISVRFENEIPEGTVQSEFEEPWKAEMKARRPRRIPEGVEEVVRLDSRTKVLIDYYQNDHLWASYNQSTYNSQNVNVDNNAIILDHIIINGYEGILFQSKIKDEKSLIWNDGIYVYCIVTVGTIDELIELSESIE